MLCFSRIFLLSALWRPHSEQIKFWVAESANDAGTLALARNYLHDLNLQNVVVTLEDGIELVGILQKIKYPRGSHAVSQLAKHIEGTSNELDARTVRQLTSDARLAGSELEYYEATLDNSSFFAALSRCACSLESTELVQLCLPFYRFAIEKDPKTKKVSSRILQLVAEELAKRLEGGSDKIGTLKFIASQGLPLENEQWGCLKKAVLAETVVSSKAELQPLLHLLAMHNVADHYSAWGLAIQGTLLQTTRVDTADVFSVVIDLIRCCSPVDERLTNQMAENLNDLTAGKLLDVLTAWNEMKLSSQGRDVLSSKACTCLETAIEMQLRRLTKPAFFHSAVLWLRCLSFLSSTKAADWMKLLNLTFNSARPFSVQDAALLSRVMITTGDFSSPVVLAVCAQAESGVSDQRESIALLHVYQKTGRKAPRGLLKRAVGHLGGRLSTTRSQDNKSHSVSPREDLVLLLAALCFVDDAEQLVLLKRLLQLQQLTPVVAMTILRYTSNANSKACQFARAKIVKGLIGSAHLFRAAELSFIMSVLAELKVRDVAAFEHLLRELDKKTPSVDDVAAAGRAAKALRLSSAFGELDVVRSLHKRPGVTPANLLAVLRCCGMERRRALLSCEEVRVMVSTVSVAEVNAMDLILLFTMTTRGTTQREAVTREMTARRPIVPRGIDADDVVGAFECAYSAFEIEAICKLCANATQDFGELHLMRLLRCAQQYASVPNTYYRFVGTIILHLSSGNRLAPYNALLWTNFYVDHRVQDDGVGRCLVAKASHASTAVSPELRKGLQKAARVYGVDQKKFKKLLKPKPKKKHSFSISYTSESVS